MKKTTRRAIVAGIAATPVVGIQPVAATCPANESAPVRSLITAHTRAQEAYERAIETNDHAAIAVTGEAESAAALALSLSLRVNPARNCHPEIAALIRHDRLGSFVATLRYEREARERGRSPFACEMDEMLGSFLRSLEMGLSQIAGIPVPASAPTIAAAYERPRLGMQFRK